MIDNARIDADITEKLFGYPITCSHGITCSDILPYSTDLDAAWMVAEKLRELGFGVYISNEDDAWMVELTVTGELYERGYRGVYSEVGDVPSTLCRAALYAVANAIKES